LIPALRPVLDQMKDSGMRMSDSLINKALRLAGEE
jgi:predicted nucleic acid-binding protein